MRNAGLEEAQAGIKIARRNINNLRHGVWRKGNPLTLLVGMQTSTATMENSVEIP